MGRPVEPVVLHPFGDGADAARGDQRRHGARSDVARAELWQDRDHGDIPLGDGNSRLRIREGEAVFSTEIDGIPVDITFGEGGVAIDEEAIEEARRRADERRYDVIRDRRDERLREMEQDAGN